MAATFCLRSSISLMAWKSLKFSSGERKKNCAFAGKLYWGSGRDTPLLNFVFLA